MIMCIDTGVWQRSKIGVKDESEASTKGPRQQISLPPSLNGAIRDT